MKLKFSDKFNCRKNSYHSSQIKLGPVLTIHRRQKSGLVYSHLYNYAGNNPVVCIDPSGEFNVRLFTFSALKMICETAEALAGFTSTGITAGLSVYLIIDGFVNMYDGARGITHALLDESYTCVVPKLVAESLEFFGLDERTSEKIGNVVGVVKGGADIFITGGANLSSSYAYTIEGLKTVDVCISIANIVSEAESVESVIVNDFLNR